MTHRKYFYIILLTALWLVEGISRTWNGDVVNH